MKVETIGTAITKAELVKIGTDPELEGFITVCFMKDNSTRLAWSNMSNEQLVFGSTMLDIEIHDVIRSQRGEENE